MMQRARSTKPPYGLLTLILTLMLAHSTAALEFPERRAYFRVPFSIDNEKQVLSSMLVGFKISELGLSHAEFLTQKSTVRQHAVSELMNALLDGDASRLLPMVKTQPVPEKERRLIDNIASLLSATKPEGIQYVREWAVGEANESLITFAIEGAHSSRRYFLSYEWNSSEGQLAWFPDRSPAPVDELSSLVVEIGRAEISGKAVEVELEADAFRFDPQLPGSGARFYFNGKSYRWKLADEQAPPGEVTDFYKRAYDALYAEGLQGFADYFTASSANKLRTWESSFKEGEAAIFQRDLRRQNRLVVFILDANPVYLVFYNSFTAGPAYDTLVRNPEDGQLKLTSFNMSGNFDRLLSNPELFWREIISPLASRGPDPDTLPLSPVVPSFLRNGSGSTVTTSTSAPAKTPAVPQASAQPTSEETTEAANERSGNSPRTWFWSVSAVILVTAGAAFYFRQKRGRRR
jgi:hypothetical protein